jgi:hypothetical protein
MKWERNRGARIVSLALALSLCGAPEWLRAQAQTSAPAAASAPSAAPNPQPLPDAPSATPASQSKNEGTQDQQQGQKPPAAPAGAAAAQAAPTAGGAGSKPAGMAIAPAKQHQVRSFLIKLGAIAGGAVAIGTVYALTRSSPSRPPGAK